VPAHWPGFYRSLRLFHFAPPPGAHDLRA
jgi:hypothetical protein